jgi:hypothetical protein
MLVKMTALEVLQLRIPTGSLRFTEELKVRRVALVDRRRIQRQRRRAR